jgi:hypothetical protein
MRWLVALMVVALQACSSAPLDAAPRKDTRMTLDETKRQLVGDWISLAPEVRPSVARNPDGTAKAFYLHRSFTYFPDDRFELTIVNSADPFAQVPLARIAIRGHLSWQGEHPIAPGAQKVDFVADEAYTVTPLSRAFVDVLNRVATSGYAKWEIGGTQSIFGKTFAPFGLTEGKNFLEYDLVYLSHDMLFWGARHVDGRGFDIEANRPTNLQIPLARK